MFRVVVKCGVPHMGYPVKLLWNKKFYHNLLLHVLIDGKTEYSTQLNRVFDDNTSSTNHLNLFRISLIARETAILVAIFSCHILQTRFYAPCALNKWFFSWPVLSKPAMMAQMAYSSSSRWQREYSMAGKKFRKTLATLPDHSKKNVLYFACVFNMCIYISRTI